ncbi:GntR family transcriptional regulator [uncultured Paludibaculum sp.]|uniref:GntR family transcriptional regulator n=1 Tax=uncultured Paludibaculum sp. TaxID=1765020 RepID=UPI002AAAED35|nr:GntR family transcriptional regulator [uncultured Paludibaculum sp.]
MSTADLTPLKAGSLPQQVVAALKNAIFSRRLKPGDLIREAKIAIDLGVSQNTVREALLELQQSGLVVRSPNRSTIVTQLSNRDIEERVSVRLLLEPECIRLASHRMQPPDFKSLWKLIHQMEEAKGPEAAHLDLNFHRVLWTCSGHRILADTLEQLVLPLFAFVTIVRFSNVENLRALAARHVTVIRALESRNEEQLADVVRNHLTEHYQDFLNQS